MQWVRMIRKNGHSVCLNIPAAVCRQLDLRMGSIVAVELVEDEGWLRVRRLRLQNETAEQRGVERLHQPGARSSRR